MNLVLGSASPRRKELLEQLGYTFTIKTQSTEEYYPDHLTHQEITDYLCLQKGNALKDLLNFDEILLTADTIVWFNNQVLAKPKDREEALETLCRLSDKWHEVITSVCFMTGERMRICHDVTRVQFENISTEIIETYLNHGNPMDKAGSYGIQEWIGLVGISRIEGSYTNVVGLPTHLVYQNLLDFGVHPNLKM
jgi:septum formation protein